MCPRCAACSSEFPGARVIIELKDTHDALARAVAELVRRLGAEGRVCVGSFNRAVLETLRARGARAS